MSKKMLQHIMTLVLVCCMVVQCFPMHLRAEDDVVDSSSIEQTQVEQTQDVDAEDYILAEEETDVVGDILTDETEMVEEEISEEITVEPETEGDETEKMEEETQEEEIIVVEDGVSYLLVSSNLNENNIVLGGLLSRIKTDAGYEPIDFLGLTGAFSMESTSELLNEVQAAHRRLNEKNVALVNCTSQPTTVDDAGVVHATSGLLYEDEDVYVYGVTALDLHEGTSAYTEAEKFTKWVNDETTDPYKVIVVLAERPLHATGQENNFSADYWHAAFNNAASLAIPRDIVVLFGDSTEEVYLSKGSEMDVQSYNQVENTTIQYTYLSNGNLSDENSAVLVSVEQESIWLRKYDTASTDAEYLGSMGRYQMPRVQTFVEETEFGDVVVSATASSMNVRSAYGEIPVLNDLMYDHMAFDITLNDYTEGDSITVTLPVFDDMRTSNFKVYHVVGEDSLEEITDYYLHDDVLIFNASSSGVFAYGEVMITVPEDAELTSLKIKRLPYERDCFVTDDPYDYFTLNIAGLIVEATYAYGTDVYVSELDWNGFDESYDGYALEFDSSIIGKQSVTVSYTYNSVTLTDQFEITIGYEDFSDAETGVELSFDHGNITAASIVDVHDDAMVVSVAEMLFDGPYVAYDITLTGHNKGEKVTVSFPVPEGADPEKLAAYHMDGPYIRKTLGYVDGGHYVFVADSFSSYLVGEETVEVADPVTKPADSSSGSFRNVWSLTDGKQYIITNSMKAGAAYAVKGDTTAAVSVTVVNDGSDKVVTTTDMSLIWTAEKASDGKWRFKNLKTNNYLTVVLSNGSSWNVVFSGNPQYNWEYIANYWGENNYRSVLIANEAWYSYFSINNGQLRVVRNAEHITPSVQIHFYEGYATSGVYSIPEQSIYSVVEPGVQQTKELVSEVLFLQGGNSESIKMDVEQKDFKYTIVKDTKGIINKIENQKLTLSGNEGAALIKVEYDPSGNSAMSGISNYILVTTVESKLTVEITDDQKKQITDVVVVKGVMQDQTDQLGVVLVDSFGGVSKDYIPENLTWVSSNENVATVDENGVVTFKGISGRVDITATYTYSNGNRVTVDTITYSVSTSTSVLPSDGTNDFPEYPNEGAVRLDKTLTTIGNFSETGIATIELSLTGVPYTVGSEIDVVLMLDRSTSMTKDRIDATVAASKLFIESIVRNEDDSFNSNRIYVGYFMGSNVIDITDSANIGGKLTSIDSENELNLLFNNITSEYTAQKGNTGTNYDVALRESKVIVDDARKDGIGNDRQQFVVFMTDGAPSTFRYITNYKVDMNPTEYRSNTLGYNQVNGDHVEYHSTLMKHDKVNIYTVGAGIEDTGNEAAILKNIASNEENAYFIKNAEDTEGLKQAFSSIATEIKNAATDVKVVDKITDEFTLVLQPPNPTVEINLPKDFEFCVELLEYTLDPVTKERMGNPVVKERITISDTDKIVLDDSGNVLKIDGQYFSYDSETHILSWNEEKLTNTEFALRYDLYLDNSIGITAEEAIESGTYPTNEYATLSYINHLGNACENEFPIPQVTYNGAQVSYVFYLVNKNGQPVNRAGKVVPFQEAVYVTDVFTETMIWKSTERQDALEATLLASDLLPDVYTLFDPMAGYQIHCFAEDTLTNNHFKIEGNEKLPLTTYVYNTKADAQKYKELSVYSKKETFLCKNYEGVTYDPKTKEFSYDKSVGLLEPYLLDGEPVFVTEVFEGEEPAYYVIAYKHGAKPVHQNFDFGNTTVAFAVLWEPKLVQDTVVIDYGLPVVVNVTQNDNLTGGIKGVLDSSPAGVLIDEGTYQKDSGFLNNINLKFGTASIESQTSIRYTLSDMVMTEPEVFYYESDVSYYDSYNNLKVENMYSSVTVIPATSIYYEDSFVDFKTYSVENNAEVTNQWVKEGTTTANAVQQTDRPGPDKIGPSYDADNVYGYDAVYSNCSQYSLGSAMKFSANSSNYGTAEFNFTGTGFDIFGVTSNTTGTILVDVYKESGDLFKTYIVDTYYGYTYDAETDMWTPVASGNNALYQIPVISVEGLTHGKYKAVISVIYSPNFDHQKDGSYDFYLDAIRIFDPIKPETVDSNEIVKDAYLDDGEYKPSYEELRNKIIAANTFASISNNDKIPGIVFIDGNAQNASVSDYKNFGPNNELYLNAGQTISFDLSAVLPAGMDVSLYDVKVQIGLKSVGGSASYKMLGITSTSDIGDKIGAASSVELNTATEMYYDITDLNNKTVIIQSTSGILSITNLKVTVKEKVNAQSAYTNHGIVNTAMITSFAIGLINVEAEEEKPLFTVDPEMTRKIVLALNGGDMPNIESPTDDQKLPLGPEAPEDLINGAEQIEELIPVDPGDLPEVAEKREEHVFEILDPEDFFEQFNVFEAQSGNIFVRALSFIASFFAEFVLWLRKLLGF